MYSNKKTKKVLLISGAALLFLVGIVAAILYFTTANKSKYGGGLEITNLDTYTKDKPSDKDSIDYIKYDLLRTVNKNVKTPVTADSVKDIVIRDKTFTQVYDDDLDVYTVNFIVDISSLSQSYDVTYQWSSDGKRDNLTEAGTVVKCLPAEKLVYGNFNCKDMFNEFSTPVDPILNYLPHTTADYKVVYDPTATKTLKATIYTTAADERIDPDTAIEQYKADVKKWVASTGVNASEYTIRYTLVRASLY